MLVTWAILVISLVVETSMSSMTLFGFVLPISLFVVVWSGYRYGGNYSLAAGLFAGLWMSFYSTNPAVTLLVYSLAGLLIGIAVSFLGRTERESRLYSFPVLILGLLIIYGGVLLPIIGSITLVHALVLMMIAIVAALIAWLGIVFVADPRP